MRISYKPTKSASRDPRRPRRQQRCAKQDRSRGRNYTSNRGGHATFNGCVRLAQDRSWRPYVLRTPDAAMRTSPSHVYYPWQVFQRWRLQSPEGALHQGSATPRCPEHQVFSKTGRYRVPSTLARRQQFSWRRNQPEPLPRGLRTAVATTTSRPPSNRDVSVSTGGARQIQQGEGAAPTTSHGGVIAVCYKGA